MSPWEFLLALFGAAFVVTLLAEAYFFTDSQLAAVAAYIREKT